MCERNAPGSAGAGGAKAGPPIECKPEKKCKTKEPKVDPECVEHGAGAAPANKALFIMDPNDPVNDERIKCLKDCHVAPVYKILQECNSRVTRKLRYTAETCHEETVDLVEALDKCVKSRAFRRLV